MQDGTDAVNEKQQEKDAKLCGVSRRLI
jgi:hypothetical protein